MTQSPDEARPRVKGSQTAMAARLSRCDRARRLQRPLGRRDYPCIRGLRELDLHSPLQVHQHSDHRRVDHRDARLDLPFERVWSHLPPHDLLHALHDDSGGHARRRPLRRHVSRQRRHDGGRHRAAGGGALLSRIHPVRDSGQLPGAVPLRERALCPARLRRHRHRNLPPAARQPLAGGAACLLHGRSGGPLHSREVAHPRASDRHLRLHLCTCRRDEQGR